MKAIKFGVLAAALFSMLAGSASAVTNVEVIQAVLGKPTYTFGSPAVNDWGSIHNGNAIEIVDGRKVTFIANPSYGGGTEHIWNTPVSVKADATQISAVMHKSPTTPDTGSTWYLKSRVCSFEPDGDFAGCGNLVQNSTTYLYYNNVPANGHAYIQTFAKVGNIFASPPQKPELYAFKVITS